MNSGPHIHPPPRFFIGERLSEVSSCISELLARIACFGVEPDEEFAGDGDADNHFGFAGLEEFFAECCEGRIETPDTMTDDKHGRADIGSSPFDVAGLGRQAGVVGKGSEACDLGNRLVVVETDLRQHGKQPGDGAARNSLDGAEGFIEFGPGRIVADEGSDLALQGFCQRFLPDA